MSSLFTPSLPTLKDSLTWGNWATNQTGTSAATEMIGSERYSGETVDRKGWEACYMWG